MLGFVLGLLLGAGWSLAYAWVWPEGAIIKAATDGTPVIAGRVVQGASVASGGGAAALRASQLLGLGSTAATLTLSRGVPAVMLASVGRVAAVALGPIGLAGLVLAEMNWNGVAWEGAQGGQPVDLWKDGCSGAYPAEFTALNQICWQAAGGPYEFLVYYPGVANSPAGVVPAGWESANNVQCSVYPALCGGATSGWGGIARRLKITCSIGHADVAGNCPTIGPASDAQVEAAIASALQANPSKAGEVLDEAIKHPQAALLLNPEPQQVSGPATVQGESETTVKQTDAGTETTTKTRQHNLQYQGNTVNVTTTTTNTTVHADNSTTTTTNTTNVAGGQAPPAPEVPDVCKDHPESSGCVPLGKAADKVDLEEKTEQVTFAQEKSDGGTCPAPIPLSFLGKSFTFDYAYICDLAIGVRPLVLAISWLGAIAWVFRVSRGATA